MQDEDADGSILDMGGNHEPENATLNQDVSITTCMHTTSLPSSVGACLP